MTTGGAAGKPSSLTEAVVLFTFPEKLPMLNFVGMEGDVDPSVIASLPFDDSVSPQKLRPKSGKQIRKNLIFTK